MATDVAEARAVNKPGKSQPRPLKELLHKTLGDAFAKQGFASTELVTRWPDIVGAEIAAHSQPEKSSGRAPPTAATPSRGPWCCGSRADRGRDPAPLGRDPGAREPLPRLAGGRQPAAQAGAASPRSTRPIPPPTRKRRPASRACRNPRREAARRARPAGRPSSSREAWRSGPPLPHSAIQDSDQGRQGRNGTDRVSHGYHRRSWLDALAPQRADRGRGGRRRGRRGRLLLEPAQRDDSSQDACRRRGCVERRPAHARPARRRGPGRRQCAGDAHRICLDDLPALRQFPRDHLSGDEEEIHRHRQDPLHFPGVSARYTGDGRLDAGALRRQGRNSSR